MRALAAADSAYAARAWGEAYAQLSAADAEHLLDARRLEQLAITAHCLGRNDESVAAWSRAFDAHLESDDVAAAAAAASWCAFGLLTRGEVVPGSGWVERAKALFEEHHLDCAAVGFTRSHMAAGLMMSGDPVTALPMFEEAAKWAERFGDRDGRAAAQIGQAQCRTQLGHTTQAMAQLDELFVTLTSQELSPLVAGLVFCAAIETCQAAFDVRRAQAWTTALSRWCDQQPDLVPYRGSCLVHRAEILALHGAWQEAYVEAERARDWLTEALADHAVGNAYYRLAELHRLRGEYSDAEAAYQNASRRGHETQPGFGLLRLAQGHVNSAAAAIRRALEEASAPGARAGLLRAQVEVSLARDDIPQATAAAAQLHEVADEAAVPMLRAQARYAVGAVRLAEGDARAALGSLREAWKIWQELDAPYEAARSRVLIGRACQALGDVDTAEMEFDAARWVFGELGAVPDLGRLEKLSAGISSAAPGGLSLRETQVLRLVAAGKTNRAIADELFLSERTVHRHLSNIFTKLDVSTRSAATAYAFKHDLA
ncbi:MAG TPA: LuxR C-terminal-related transcriptional regulator [Mycobacteriales bacterium]|nr:LuxR C-terminal-related transcriptional regulator [Mycobacteriales bacterium]